MSVEIDDLRNELKEAKEKEERAKSNELELRKLKRDLENKKNEMELEHARKLDEERNKLSEMIKQKAQEETALTLAEKDKQISDMKNLIDELKRKSHVTSQQLQGEVLEIKIETLLKDHFQDDKITEVKKGMRGADIIQEVRLPSGRPSGVILIECKQASEWGGQWISKLKEDMLDKGCDLGVIVSTVLPKDCKNIDVIEGVWVCTPMMVKTLVSLLREQLIRAARAELSAATPKDQMDQLFRYMTSPKFAQKIQGMCEGVKTMKETLDSEKRALQKNWKKREQEIEGFELQMINLYGELEGVVGTALPRVEYLQLESSATQLSSTGIF